MKQIVLRKTKDGRLTTMPRTRLMITSLLVKDVKVEDEDMSMDYPVAKKAEREMETISKKVSQELFDLMMMQLMGFRGDMQYVMAENLVIFTCDHTAYTTGCPSVDAVLDICYTWIADEQGIVIKKYRKP